MNQSKPRQFAQAILAAPDIQTEISIRNRIPVHLVALVQAHIEITKARRASQEADAALLAIHAEAVQLSNLILPVRHDVHACRFCKGRAVA